MIDEEVARDGMALLVTAAAMLVEDGQPALLKTPTSAAAAAVWAATFDDAEFGPRSTGRRRLRACSP
jgi:hypothetical protein